MASSVALEALLLSLIAFSFPAFVDPRGSFIGPVLAGLAVYAPLATALNARWFFRGAVSRPDGMRAIAMAVLIGMMAPLFIVTVVAVVRVLLLRLFDG